MEAKELRIGNWVNRAPLCSTESRLKNVNCYVNIMLADGLVDNNSVICDYDDLEPIPLTEEWLLKFGFKTDFYGGQGNVCYYASKGKFKIYSIEDNKSYQYDYTRNMFTMIKHVHELQNLYYALTKKELTIKK